MIVHGAREANCVLKETQKDTRRYADKGGGSAHDCRTVAPSGTPVSAGSTASDASRECRSFRCRDLGVRVRRLVR
jgi:hypothetical protein